MAVGKDEVGSSNLPSSSNIYQSKATLLADFCFIENLLEEVCQNVKKTVLQETYTKTHTGHKNQFWGPSCAPMICVGIYAEPAALPLCMPPGRSKLYASLAYDAKKHCSRFYPGVFRLLYGLFSLPFWQQKETPTHGGAAQRRARRKIFGMSCTLPIGAACRFFVFSRGGIPPLFYDTAKRRCRQVPFKKISSTRL